MDALILRYQVRRNTLTENGENEEENGDNEDSEENEMKNDSDEKDGGAESEDGVGGGGANDDNSRDVELNIKHEMRNAADTGSSGVVAGAIGAVGAPDKESKSKEPKAKKLKHKILSKVRQVKAGLEARHNSRSAEDVDYYRPIPLAFVLATSVPVILVCLFVLIRLAAWEACPTSEAVAAVSLPIWYVVRWWWQRDGHLTENCSGDNDR